MPKLKAVFAGSIALLLLVCTTVDARSLAIQRFDASIGVDTDGSINVEERIVVQFTGSWTGIYRTIPVDYRTPQALKYSLRLSIDSIKNQFGDDLKFEATRERSYRKIKIWVPGAQDSTHTVYIRYHVANALRFFDEHDELYWNVTGDEWDVPIASASATILLPPGATGLRGTAFRGAHGSTERNEVAIAPHMVRVSTAALAFREGLTAVVGWNPGVVYRPNGLERWVETLRSNWQLAAPVVAVVLMGGLWLIRGRDPQPGPITTLYEPPQDMSPAEAGALIDGSVDMRDITATIVDLAVRGYSRIEEQHEGASAAASSEATRPAVTGYTFTSVRPHKDWDGLKPHESLLMNGLFAAADRVSTSDLTNSFYEHLGGIRGSVSSANDEKYYVRDPLGLVALSGLAGMIIFVGPIVWAVASFFTGGAFGLPTVATVVSGLVTGSIVIGFAIALPARTKAGTRALEKVLGFQEFLSRVDGDRLKRIVQTPDVFEKYLPYAMALGVETEWAGAFREIYTHAPAWYGGASSDSFDLTAFSGQMERMSANLATVLPSRPRPVSSSSDNGDSGRDWSSGGSGFSGGSSGGGFGGGGGGGF